MCISGIILFGLFNNPAVQTLAPRRQRSTPLSPTSTFHSTSIPRRAPTIAYPPVTWMELIRFFEGDRTNFNSNNKYDPIIYICRDFAVDLVENAETQNIKAWIVGVEFYDDEISHAFVAFVTNDRGVVYIEPQADIPYSNPEVGQRLCDAWGKYECWEIIKEITYLQCGHQGRRLYPP